MSAGHGQSMFMSQQEERWLMREHQDTGDCKVPNRLSRRAQRMCWRLGVSQPWARNFQVMLPGLLCLHGCVTVGRNSALW